jgi:hypothetical protein
MSRVRGGPHRACCTSNALLQHVRAGRSCLQWRDIVLIGFEDAGAEYCPRILHPIHQ